MKIAIISEAKGLTNGVNTTYTNLTPALKKQGIDVRVIGSGDFNGRVSLPNYPEIELVVWKPYSKIERLLNATKPDHIHIATEGPLGMAAASYCRQRDLKYTTAFHTMFHLYVRQSTPRPLRDAFENAALGHLRRFHNAGRLAMAPTPGLIDELQKSGFTRPLRLISRGVDLDLYRPGPRTEFLDVQKPIALFVGRISETQKNIRAFLDLKIPGWTKIAVGDGPDLPALRKAYAHDHDIIFAGKKTGADLAACYRSANVFVMPSVLETFGNVTTEALASGLPVAALSSTANKSILRHDYLGAVDDNLAVAFDRATHSPGTALDRHSHIKNTYTWPRVAEQFISNISEANPELRLTPSCAR